MEGHSKRAGWVDFCTYVFGFLRQSQTRFYCLNFIMSEKSLQIKLLFTFYLFMNNFPSIHNILQFDKKILDNFV